MVVFLYRPSPQVPRPSVQAAMRCYDACQYNIYMTMKQIETRSVDMTWIFVQSIFMCINTMLWTLSYSEVRKCHTREEVEAHLNVAMDSIRLASERWPGVASAMELYYNLTGACMKTFDKDGDVPITAASPSDTASVVSSTMVDGINRSRTTSPATASTPATSVRTPSDQAAILSGSRPDQSQTSRFSFNGHQPNGTSSFSPSPHNPSASLNTPSQQPPQLSYTDMSPKTSMDPNIPVYGLTQATNLPPRPMPFAELPQWNPTYSMPPQEQYGMPTMPMASPFYNEAYAANQGFEVADYLNPGWSQDARGNGLNQEQQMQLMHDLEMNEMKNIEEMIQQSHQLFRPPQLQTY